ncbi:MAG: TRAP transporter permease [Thermoprotei archaeon]|nr:MAG: TRAP transporter permease [Thermoprotei archaeon]
MDTGYNSSITWPYVLIDFDWVISRVWSVTPLKPIERILGILLIILIIEATRRTVGNALACLALFFTVYPLFASHFPGLLRGGSASLEELIETNYLTTEGILSIPIGVSATIVILFLIFAAFLEKAGIGEYFMKAVISLVGRRKGGPAKVSVISSGFFGMLSGSAVANVYGTGSFTIPMMIRVGFPRNLAGAIEAVASTGGQIMPPIMGAGAFIMASLLGIPYLSVVIAAIIPAILYYFGAYMVIHFVSERDNLGVVPEDFIPPKKEVLKNSYLLIPIIVLVYVLVSRTVSFAAITGIVAVVIIFFLRSILSKNLTHFAKNCLLALAEGTQKAIPVAMACGAAGLVIGSMNLTGFGFKIVGAILNISLGIGIIALILVAIICVIMGMGLPPTAAYVIVAAISTPALIKLGYQPLSSHFFVYYYAILSNITYPVALAVYAAASLSGGNPRIIGMNAVKLGFMAFIVPFMFIYNNSLLFQGNILKISLSLVLSLIATVLISASITGYFRKRLNKFGRIIYLTLGCILLLTTIFIGFL